jgi:hypothetical protein
MELAEQLAKAAARSPCRRDIAPAGVAATVAALRNFLWREQPFVFCAHVQPVEKNREINKSCILFKYLLYKRRAAASTTARLWLCLYSGCIAYLQAGAYRNHPALW